jgi:hypothetical protein
MYKYSFEKICIYNFFIKKKYLTCDEAQIKRLVIVKVAHEERVKRKRIHLLHVKPNRFLWTFRRCIPEILGGRIYFKGFHFG